MTRVSSAARIDGQRGTKVDHRFHILRVRFIGRRLNREQIFILLFKERCQYQTMLVLLLVVMIKKTCVTDFPVKVKMR